MEEGEGHSGISPGGPAEEAPVQPSGERQTHPAATTEQPPASATRGQCNIEMMRRRKVRQE